MTENLIPGHILAKRREKFPNARPLSEAEIVILSSVTRSITEGAKVLAQYGSIDIAAITAGLAGATSVAIETAHAVKK